MRLVQLRDIYIASTMSRQDAPTLQQGRSAAGMNWCFDI